MYNGGGEPMLFKRKEPKKPEELTREEVEKAYGGVLEGKGPPPAVIEARQKPQFVIDPKEVASKDDSRVRLWAAAIMKKHDSKLSDKCKEMYPIATGDIEPEDIDVINFFYPTPFKDLHWILYRKDGAIEYNKKTGEFVRNSKMPKQLMFHLKIICKAHGAQNFITLFETGYSKI